MSISGNGTIAGNGRIAAISSISFTYHNLTIQNGSYGTSFPPAGTFSFIEDSDVHIYANPDSGRQLDHWEKDTVGAGNANPYTINMDNDHTLKCFFTALPPPPPKYDVTLYSSIPYYDRIWFNGDLYSSNGDVVELEAGTYSLVADIQFGTFDSWSFEGDVSVDDIYNPNTTVTVSGSGSVTLNVV